MRPMNYFMVLIGFAQAAVFAAAPETRVSGGLYTPERLANLRANTQKYDWARKDREDTVKQAAPWLAKSNEALWRMVPGQNLPRCIDVTMTNGAANKVSGVCPNCGTGIKPYGNYPWIADPERRPWKIQCPNCKAIFPTNDFGKYYESGLDEHGVFDPKLADRKLLFNTEHPDPADPKHLGASTTASASTTRPAACNSVSSVITHGVTGATSATGSVGSRRHSSTPATSVTRPRRRSSTTGSPTSTPPWIGTRTPCAAGFTPMVAHGRARSRARFGRRLFSTTWRPITTAS